MCRSAAKVPFTQVSNVAIQYDPASFPVLVEGVEKATNSTLVGLIAVAPIADTRFEGDTSTSSD